MNLKYLPIVALALFSLQNCKAMDPSEAMRAIAEDQKISYVSATTQGIPNFIKTQLEMSEKHHCKELLNLQAAKIEEMGGMAAVLSRGKQLYEQHEGKQADETQAKDPKTFDDSLKAGLEFINTKGYEEHFKEESGLLTALRDVCKEKDSEERYKAIGKILSDICDFEDTIGFRFPMSVTAVYQYNFVKYVFSLLDFADIFDIDQIDPSNEYISEHATKLFGRFKSLGQTLQGV